VPIRPAALATRITLGLAACSLAACSLVACGPGGDGTTATPAGSPSASSTSSPSSDPTMTTTTTTKLTTLAPVDADGDVAQGYTVEVDGHDEVDDCSPTWTTDGDSIYTCGITADAHVACWPESASQALCLSDPWDRSLTRILVGDFGSGEGANPTFGLEVRTGSGTDRCTYRVSGAVSDNETDDRLVVSHLCGGNALLWDGPGHAAIDRTSRPWTAYYGESDDAPRRLPVTVAYAVAVADDITPPYAGKALAKVTVRGPVDDLSGIQKYADILAAGDLDRLRRGCWTIAPETLEKQLAQRATILDAFRKPGEGAQSALFWRNDRVMITFPWAEVESPLACPGVGPAATGTPFTAADAAWVVHRLAMRYAGTPVAASDTEASYPLACEAPVWIEPPFATMSDATKRARLEALDGRPLIVRTIGEHQRAQVAGGSAYAEFSNALGICIGDLGR
jgi:hypothetical protein